MHQIESKRLFQKTKWVLFYLYLILLYTQQALKLLKTIVVLFFKSILIINQWFVHFRVRLNNVTTQRRIRNQFSFMRITFHSIRGKYERRKWKLSSANGCKLMNSVATMCFACYYFHWWWWRTLKHIAHSHN